MEKTILSQYVDMKAEVVDLRRRIDDLQVKIGRLSPVTDSVRGTRSDGTIGAIVVTGYPEPEYYKKQRTLNKYKALLKAQEDELLELMIGVEEYIETVESSEMRMLLRMFYIDDLSYIQVARQMNMLHPKRKKKYTDESVRKKIERFF